MKNLVCLGVSINTRPMYSANINKYAYSKAYDQVSVEYDGIYGNAAESYHISVYKEYLNDILYDLFDRNFMAEREAMSWTMTEEEREQEKAAYKAAFGAEYDEAWF